MAVTFHHTRRGAFQEREDRWTLTTRGDGGAVVEHVWSHFNAYTRQPDAGSATFGVEEFLAGAHNSEAKARLREHLAKEGRAKGKTPGRRRAAA